MAIDDYVNIWNQLNYEPFCISLSEEKRNFLLINDQWLYILAVCLARTMFI